MLAPRSSLTHLPGQPSEPPLAEPSAREERCRPLLSLPATWLLPSPIPGHTESLG